VTFKTTRHEYWNATQDRLVEPGSAEAAFLAFPAGTELTDADARKWGLVPAKGADPEPGLEVDPPPEPKKVGRPPNKMGSAVPNKAAVKDDDTL
jgi:hypothetical protein